MTFEEKRGALNAINLIKEKRDGTIKGRCVANGRKQRGLYAKEETASPTISNDAMMMSLIIDAMEARDVAIADVKGAYLLADMKGFVLLKMSGESVDILCKVNSKYRQFVVEERGKKVIYLRLLKALYGCVQSALLWYQLITSKLVEMGFELNPYDECVANKMINGKQCTMGFWVDDNKISHEDPRVVSDVIEQLEKYFGKMVVTRGRDHSFLGMELSFKDNNTVHVSMKQLCKEAIEAFDEDLRESATTPAKKGLFTVKDNEEALDDEKRSGSIAS